MSARSPRTRTTQSAPAISGDRIVWQDVRNGNNDIYMFDLAAAVDVATDVKPQSCPNPLSRAAKGKLLVAILGTATFDVSTVIWHARPHG